MKAKVKRYFDRMMSIQVGVHEFRQREKLDVIMQRKPESSSALLLDKGVLVNTQARHPRIGDVK